jgi:hypothetical protein
MRWDDNWTRALVTVGAAAIGAILAGLASAYAARQKVREVELQYLYKLRDGYLDNARKFTGEVYVPISIALTTLFKSYERFAATFGVPATENAPEPLNVFRADCAAFVQAIDDLLARGADAYLTTGVDERLNDFTNFIRNSIDVTEVRKRRVLKTMFGILGLSIAPNIVTEDPARSRFARATIPNLSLKSFGFKMDYSEKVLVAPMDSREFELRIRTEVPEIKFLIKEVTLGSSPPPA